VVNIDVLKIKGNENKTIESKKIEVVTLLVLIGHHDMKAYWGVEV
jgi:hypothetical protein